MVAKVFENIDEAAERYSGLARKAIDYGRFQKRLMDRAVAQVPDYSPDEWLGLKDLVTDDFERIGNFKEVMTIDQMIAFLQAWAPTSAWEGSFKRVTEHDNVVILELEERVQHDGHWNAVNSVSIYEYNDEGKLRHLDVYLQAVPGDVEKGESYDV
ncbi:hypothetical protein [Novosphingobium album (ex Hu et al. 2023)]|uniref:Nuclear transport factor 2 family protein n=1 Tax=Novosphingobium album (ex Hu et al. 2023) TaxID=2930093 RepID=A0ABT0B5A7_9SPHN|nr:hypothetical protein [Novosphingobium album (ex Hu et al. 2023)]MCJ2180247.1 hypothetical protein [Novosphingobium album (ex Hu et al. 2023)]